MDEKALFRRLAYGTVVAMAALIVFGGIVRITESGLGCGDDWPLCNGEVVPSFTFPVAIEYGHRVIAAVVSTMVAALALIGWFRHRAHPELYRPAFLAVVLIVIQIMLGAVTVWLELPPITVILHFVNALAALAAVLVAGLRARPYATEPMAIDRFSMWTMIMAGLGAIVILMGAWVANIDAGPACLGFPLCNGEVLPGPGVRIHVHWTHRIAAYALVVCGIGVTALAYRERGGDSRILKIQWASIGLIVVQIIVAAVMVLQLLPSEWRALHVATGTAIWIALVLLVYWGRHPSAAQPVQG